MELGRDPGTNTYWALGNEDIEPVAGAFIVRFEAELFFANVSVLRSTVLQAVDSRSPDVVILDAESITHVDTTAADELNVLLAELDTRGIQFCVARLERSVEADLRRCGVDLSGRLHARVADAVEAAGH